MERLLVLLRPNCADGKRASGQALVRSMLHLRRPATIAWMPMGCACTQEIARQEMSFNALSLLQIPVPSPAVQSGLLGLLAPLHVFYAVAIARNGLCRRIKVTQMSAGTCNTGRAAEGSDEPQGGI